MPEVDNYAVFGHPISHSRSPDLYCKAFDHYGIKARYLRVDALYSEEVLHFVKDFRLKGFNITSPLKTSIIKYLDHIDDIALKTNSVNLVKVLNDGKYYGYNTDYYGVMKSLENTGIKGKHIAVIGWGGAARSAVYALYLLGITGLRIINRSKIDFSLLSDLGIKYDLYDLNHLEKALANVDCIINCIPPVNHIKKEMLNSKMLVFDANYYNSYLEKIANDLGCIIISGHSWLFYQFAKSFQILTGLSPQSVIYDDQPSRIKKKAISLIGFMGSGKTAVGIAISKKINLRHFDLDKKIEEISGRSICELFKTKQGEQYFRDQEALIISKLKFEEDTVYSFGGGSVINSRSREILRDHSICILLWAPLDILFHRIKNSSRPLLKSYGSIELLHGLLCDRLNAYLETAAFIVLSLRETDITAERIIENRT